MPTKHCIFIFPFSREKRTGWDSLKKKKREMIMPENIFLKRRKKSMAGEANLLCPGQI